MCVITVGAIVTVESSTGIPSLQFAGSFHAYRSAPRLPAAPVHAVVVGAPIAGEGNQREAASNAKDSMAERTARRASIVFAGSVTPQISVVAHTHLIHPSTRAWPAYPTPGGRATIGTIAATTPATAA